MRIILHSLLALAFLSICTLTEAQEKVDCVVPELREGMYSDSIVAVQSADTLKKGFWDKKFWHQGVMGKIYSYFERANTEKPLNKSDFSFLGGPYYNKTTGFGIGLVGSGLYHMQPSNTNLQQSSVSLTGRATVKGMFSVTLRGLNYFPEDRFRSEFKVELSTFKTNFWGMGFHQCDDDENKSLFRRNQLKLDGCFLFRLAKNTYIGPCLYYSLYYAMQRDSLADVLLTDLPTHTSAIGGGMEFRFDNRDFALDAKHGCFVNLKQRIGGAGQGVYHTTEMRVCGYTPTWRDCTLACEVHSLLNYGGGLPWTEMATVGSNDRMRGYYEERYRDRNIIEAQIELRQHIKGRHGIVVFAGFANAFRDTHSWRFSHTLPNYGIGYRWRFKPGVNIRLDFGLTNKDPGFIFAVNEAF